MKKKYALYIFIILSGMITFLFTGCSKSEDAGKSGGRDSRAIVFPVETQEVKSQSVTYSIYAVGSVEAFEVVQVTSRVSGVVDKVLFTEGVRVQANQPLVEIETERYRLAVESARASFEKSKASRADAEAGLKRRKGVVEKNPGLIPGEELETWETKVRTATSEMALAQAQLHQAELNLRDAQVKAPVNGIVQSRTVQTGQYVQPGTILATMIRRDPLLVRFKVPEQDSAQIKTGMTAYFQVKDDKTEYSSKIIYVSDAADLSTRMAPVTAEVIDKNRENLRAGAFAEIRIPVGNNKNAPVIPQVAVRPSEKGFLAYIVENATAKERILTLGMKTADGLVEVKDGLKVGESLVIRGAEALRDGVPVRLVKSGQIVSSPVKNSKPGENPLKTN